MRLALLALVLAACASSAPPPVPPARSVMVVDRTYMRDREREVAESDELPATSYKAVTPADRWNVAIEGASIVLTPIGKPQARIEGVEKPGAKGERRFDLTSAFAGGRFVLRGDDAELTIYGSGVPIISSERGKLVVK